MSGYLVAIIALIAAEQAKMEAMKASNENSRSQGGGPIYLEGDFNLIASELQRLAIEARNL